jgi:hypothetical protein
LVHGIRTHTLIDLNKTSPCDCSECQIGRGLRNTAMSHQGKWVIAQQLVGRKLSDFLYGNLAYAEAEIEGQTFRYLAHTRITQPVKGWLPVITVTNFESLSVNMHREMNCNGAKDRKTDTEARIFEALHLSLIKKNLGAGSSGVVKLYTRREPCMSCEHILVQFAKHYTHIRIEVYCEEPYPKKEKPHG